MNGSKSVVSYTSVLILPLKLDQLIATHEADTLPSTHCEAHFWLLRILDKVHGEVWSRDCSSEVKWFIV